MGRTAVVGAAEGQADAPNTGEPGTREVIDDARPRFQDDWRRRYAEAGGTFDEYEPAYAHGYRLASHERWRGRAWDEVEAHARVSWEQGRPGTWDRFKDVVRRGWEWLTVPEDDQSSMRRGP